MALNFPIWLIVNNSSRPKDGYPYYFMTRGDYLLAFTKRELAEPIGTTWPFRIQEATCDHFVEILKERRDFAHVLFDMGTEDAIVRPVKDLLEELG